MGATGPAACLPVPSIDMCVSVSLGILTVNDHHPLARHPRCRVTIAKQNSFRNAPSWRVLPVGPTAAFWSSPPVPGAILHLTYPQTVAGWADLPALRQCRPRAYSVHAWQDYSPWPAQMLRVQGPVHRSAENHLRKFASALAPLVANHPSDVRQQEGHIDQPNSADAVLQHEDRLVPWPSHPRSHEGRKLVADGRPPELQSSLMKLSSAARKARRSAADTPIRTPFLPSLNVGGGLARSTSKALRGLILRLCVA